MPQLTTFAMDGNDLALNSEGRFYLLEDQYAVQQIVDVYLSIEKGEWALNITIGVAYRAVVFDPYTSDGVLLAQFVAAVSACPGIIRVTDQTVSRDSDARTAVVNITAESIWGEIVATIEPDDLVPILLITITGPLGPFES